MAQKEEGRRLSRNVEIKARVRAVEEQRGLADALRDAGPETLRQEDRYFHSPQGRLKLREIDNRPAELIYYERANADGPRESRYFIAPVDDPMRVGMLLDAALGTLSIVRKERTLFLIGQTRVHFDSVEGLGEFIELEVVLREDQTIREGETIARDLMRRLRIDGTDLIAESYLDLSQT